MNTYKMEDIRNVAVMGHGKCGKSSIIEAMLFNSGAITRLGKNAEGNVAFLKEYLSMKGIKVKILPFEKVNSQKISTKHIKKYNKYKPEDRENFERYFTTVGIRTSCNTIPGSP